MASPSQQLTAFQCRMVRKIYEKKDTGFAIVSVEPGAGSVVPTNDGHRPLSSVVKGNFSSVFEHLSPGLELKCYGRWETRDGKLQFDAKFVMEAMPTSLSSLEKLLASGKFKGIGPALARRIVSRFGADSMQVLSQTPDRLAEVEGINAETAKAAGESWKAWRGANGVVDYLRERNIGEAIGEKIWKAYGDRSLEVIRRSPYELVKIGGIGFKTADKIAMSEGVDRMSPFRLAAAVKHVLDESMKNDGNFAIKESTLLRRVQMELDDAIKRADIQVIVNDGLSRGRLVSRDFDIMDGKGVQKFITMPSLLSMEKEMASDLKRLSVSGSMFSGSTSKFSEGLDDSQKFALMSAVSSKVSVVTGGPGTGKSHTLKNILSAVNELHKGAKIKLCAPTGKAAQRMNELTGFEASTMHRLLQFGEGGFRKNRNSMLDVDFLALDEGSMTDAYAGLALLRALPDHASLLLIGDVDQLKPVGPGAFFSDIIDSGCFPVARLNESHRQDEGSGIVRSAHRILNSQMPEFGRWDDFVFIPSEEDGAASKITSLIKELLEDGVDPYSIQLLTPKHDGQVGTISMNASLKPLLNPFCDDREIISGLGERFRFSVGDRIMQCRNNYDLDVFNGEVGRITDMDVAAAMLEVDFDGKIVAFDAADMGDLKPSFAMTVHKSQGSEFGYVIIPVCPGNSYMLDLSLLYTAVTRARQKVILVGDEDVLKRAIMHRNMPRRVTFLADEIRHELARRSVVQSVRM